MTEKEKIPYLVSNPKYAVEKEHGCILHQDVDSVYCTAPLFIYDTSEGKLLVEGPNNLPELCYPGDVVFMKPRVAHKVGFTKRKECRKVVVLTI